MEKKIENIDEWSFYKAYPLYQQLHAQLHIWEVEDPEKLLKLVMMSVRKFIEEQEKK